MQRLPSQSLGNISTRYALLIFRTCEALGKPVPGLQDKYHLPPAFLNQPDSRISIPKFMRLGYDAITELNRPDLGLEMGKQMHVGDLGMAGNTATFAPDLETAMKTLIHFEWLTSRNIRGRTQCYMEDGRLVTQFYSIDPYNDFNYFVVDSMLSSWRAFASWLLGKQADLHQVEVEFDEHIEAKQYEFHFSCPVVFGGKRNALVFKRGEEKKACRYANIASFAELYQISHQMLSKWERGRTLADRVADHICQTLSRRQPNIDEVAETMGMSGWTLRRRLREENVIFRELLDETRKELSIAYVRDTRNNFTEISYLLGFANPSAFQRAFKRWFDLSPGELRQRYISTASSDSSSKSSTSSSQSSS